MGVSQGLVSEISLDRSGQTLLRVLCSPKAVPQPGQYLSAWESADDQAPLAATLFPVKIASDGFVALLPPGANWLPGSAIFLNGPVGHAFHLPRQARRIGLIALGESLARLQPLIPAGLRQAASLAIFTDCSLPDLPAAVEVNPLVNACETLAWADFLALDLRVEQLNDLRNVLALEAGEPLPCPAQALLLTAMPCAGIAECGVCAVSSRHGWLLACKDGPVFNLTDLDW